MSTMIRSDLQGLDGTVAIAAGSTAMAASPTLILAGLLLLSCP
jgi:hypothetical protein